MSVPTNLDLRTGLGLLAAAALVAVLCTLWPAEFGRFWEVAGALASFGVVALARFMKRPADGEPGPALPILRVLKAMGIEPAESDSATIRRIDSGGWVDVEELEPDVGDPVLLFVDGNVMTGVWGDEASTMASSWRRPPSPPPFGGGRQPEQR